jgi:putative transcriptional regulator
MLDMLGKFIVARPTMRDGRFREAVILIVEHSKSHSMGLVINKPVGKPNLNDIAKDFKIQSVKKQKQPYVYYGGPVGLNKIIVLHTPDWESNKNTFKFNDEIWASNSPDIVKAVMEHNSQGPSKWIICIGQCQWGAGQLEAELLATNGRLKTDAWLPTPADPGVVFSMKNHNRWKKSLTNIAKNQFNRVFNHAVSTAE